MSVQVLLGEAISTNIAIPHQLSTISLGSKNSNSETQTENPNTDTENPNQNEDHDISTVKEEN